MFDFLFRGLFQLDGVDPLRVIARAYLDVDLFPSEATYDAKKQVVRDVSGRNHHGTSDYGNARFPALKAETHTGRHFHVLQFDGGDTGSVARFALFVCCAVLCCAVLRCAAVVRPRRSVFGSLYIGDASNYRLNRPYTV